MIEYYDNTLCIEVGWLTDPELGVMSQSNYDSLRRRGWLRRMRRACRGTPALVEYASLPPRYREAVEERLGYDPATRKEGGFRSRIERDADAMAFYSGYRLTDGRALPGEVIEDYVTNASVLNTIRATIADRKMMGRAMNGTVRGMWAMLMDVVESIRPEVGHSLPGNERRLKERYSLYIKEGYTALIHRGYCNDNSRKVSDDMERLILSLYGMPEKPYTNTVAELYLQFVGGAIDVADMETGELFDRNSFYDDGGAPIVISESTCWNYINDPKNRTYVDKVRNGSLEFTATHRPHHHRHKPVYALSKVSLDDRDLPRKMTDGNRVKAYYAYDVASGCVVGASYSKRKDTGLFIDCIRDMFGFLRKNDCGMPMEMEVEHHIVNQFKDDLMQAGIVFPFVRWCNPGNSQEKHAEHFNREKKYGYEKRYQQGIGRFYARLEANKPRTEKIASETNDQWKERTYNYEELVADDRDVIERYNNDLHPNQKKYRNKTRMQVLLENLNPNLAQIDEALLTRYIGDMTRTTIRRNQYVTVQYGKYQLSTPEALERLMPNSYEVEAYYLRNDDETIERVYIYQGGVLIDTCHKIETYNTATAEQTEADKEAYTEQSKYVSRFDKMVKDGKEDKVKRVAVMRVSNTIEGALSGVANAEPLTPRCKQGVDEGALEGVENAEPTTPRCRSAMPLGSAKKQGVDEALQTLSQQSLVTNEGQAEANMELWTEAEDEYGGDFYGSWGKDSL